MPCSITWTIPCANKCKETCRLLTKVESQADSRTKQVLLLLHRTSHEGCCLSQITSETQEHQKEKHRTEAEKNTTELYGLQENPLYTRDRCNDCNDVIKQQRYNWIMLHVSVYGNIWMEVCTLILTLRMNCQLRSMAWQPWSPRRLPYSFSGLEPASSAYTTNKQAMNGTAVALVIHYPWQICCFLFSCLSSRRPVHNWVTDWYQQRQGTLWTIRWLYLRLMA
jgi:hypothetical protein